MGQTYPVPPPAGSYTPAYVPTIDYFGGAYGDDVEQSTANATNDFSPRHQSDKATALGVAMAEDVGVPRGWIAPGEPYGPVPASPDNDPTITALAPNTAVAGGPAITVIITGTNFTSWSQVLIGGAPAPDYKVLSDTQIELAMDVPHAVAGAVDIAVVDHGIESDPSAFTFTA